MADVTITYAGNEIAAMNDTGTKTLETQGKYCTDDITVSYTKSGGGGSSQVFIFTDVGYTNASVFVSGHTATPRAAFSDSSIVSGATITFYTYGDYILDSITGLDSGNPVSYNTVSRGNYTFTMPNESVYCALLYDD